MPKLRVSIIMIIDSMGLARYLVRSLIIPGTDLRCILLYTLRDPVSKPPTTSLVFTASYKALRCLLELDVVCIISYITNVINKLFHKK